jgi:hypothetical protein
MVLGVLLDTYPPFRKPFWPVFDYFTVYQFAPACGAVIRQSGSVFWGRFTNPHNFPL